jgi:hypothetical protein
VARYVVHARSPKSQAEAFAYMADLSNFAAWDPGVVRVEQVAGKGAGPDAVFDVDVKSVGKPLTLRYRTTFHDSPKTVVVRAQSRLLTSLDTISVRADGTGSIVTYDAELSLNGIFGVADSLVRLAFNRIGDRAAVGLVKALEGERLLDSNS